MPLDLDQVGKGMRGTQKSSPLHLPAQLQAFEHPRVDSLLLWVLQSDINDLQHQF